MIFAFFNASFMEFAPGIELTHYRLVDGLLANKEFLVLDRDSKHCAVAARHGAKSGPIECQRGPFCASP